MRTLAPPRIAVLPAALLSALAVACLAVGPPAAWAGNKARAEKAVTKEVKEKWRWFSGKQVSPDCTKVTKERYTCDWYAENPALDIWAAGGATVKLDGDGVRAKLRRYECHAPDGAC